MEIDGKATLLQTIQELDLGTERLVDRKTSAEPVKKAARRLEDYEGSFVVPLVGKPHPTDRDLIGVNEFGDFNTNTFKFQSEPKTLTANLLEDVLRLVGWIEADELFMQEDEPLKIKFGHKTKAITKATYSAAELHECIGALVNTSVPGRVIGGESEPFSLAVAWVNKEGKQSSLRFRGNGTRTMGRFGSTSGVIYAIRRLGDKIPTMEGLGIPSDLQKKFFPKAGIVIVAGETGSGKSTLLASVAGHTVSTPPGIVLSTYEYPVEFDYRPMAHPDSVVGQTDLSNALKGSYAEAIKDAMRRNSDVILIGEVRDMESAKGAMSAATSGHLVYCTFHAGSPMEAMDRIISYFPSEEQASIRNTLINTLQLIVCVKLVPTTDDKRVQIRGYLEIDREARDRLSRLQKDTFVAGIRAEYDEHGYTMRKDLERYKNRIDPVEYEKNWKLFH